MYELLNTINYPHELRQLERSQLPRLAEELRRFLLESVSQTGGHLSSNLGTVELTIALHYVFDTPHDRIVWDVGHQTYGHKVLTGRLEGMKKLRMWGGISCGSSPSRLPPRYAPTFAKVSIFSSTARTSTSMLQQVPSFSSRTRCREPSSRKHIAPGSRLRRIACRWKACV